MATKVTRCKRDNIRVFKIQSNFQQTPNSIHPAKFAIPKDDNRIPNDTTINSSSQI